jgi:hypothetical protein
MTLRLAALLALAAVGAGLGWWLAGGLRPVPAAPDPLAGLAPRLALVQDLATARLTFRAIVRGEQIEHGRLWNNTDEVLISTTVSGDWGFDLARLDPERLSLTGDLLTVRLPPPRLLAPGFSDQPATLLDTRTSRWIGDPGPGHLAAVRAARTQALAEAPTRVTALGLDEEVRTATVRALTTLLPGLLGRPGLRVAVRFDDRAVAP